MTNKSPRLPRKAFALPAPPAPPNSPALLPPAPAKQDSFALRVVEGIEDAALVEIKCDAPATKTAIDVMVVLDISGSMSTECKVQDASGKAQKHGFSILDVCKHATRALAATLDGLPGASALNFSPSKTYLAIYQKQTSTGASKDTKNMTIWNITGLTTNRAPPRKVYEVFQRQFLKAEWPYFQFSDDDSTAVRCVSNEIQIIRPAEGFDRHARLRVPSVAVAKISH